MNSIFTLLRTVISTYLLLSAITTHALVPSASISNPRVEETYLNGEPSYKFLSDINVKGMKGKKIKVVIWVESPKGTPHMMYDSSNKVPDVDYLTRTLSVNYDSSDWNGYSYHMKQSDLQLKPGRNDYYVFVTVNDASNGRFLGRSADFKFSAAPRQPQNRREPAHNHPSAPDPARTGGNRPGPRNDNGIINQWRVDLPNGYQEYTQYADGRLRCYTRTVCHFCHGNGICSICHGSRGSYNSYTGIYTPCYGCLQSGSCKYCNGTGIQEMVSIAENGRAIGIGSDGTVSDSERYRAEREYEREQRDMRRNGTCDVCRGTGVQDFPMYRNDPSGAATHAVGEIGYTNQRGHICRYCGSADYHIHLKCYKCR